MDVTGTKGEIVTWKSSCGGYAYTVVDGIDEYAVFWCGQDVTEQVKCVFHNPPTNSSECYSEKGSCKGFDSCTVNVAGKKGEIVTWKSSCGGYDYTTIDGINEYVDFC